MSFLCHKSEIASQTLILELFFPHFYFGGQSFFFFILSFPLSGFLGKKNITDLKITDAQQPAKVLKGEKEQMVWRKGPKRIVFPVSPTF